MLKQKQRHVIKCLYLYDVHFLMLSHNAYTSIRARWSCNALNHSSLRGDVSVCIVPANVVYLFIYLFMFLERKRKVANSLACLTAEQCQTLNCPI